MPVTNKNSDNKKRKFITKKNNWIYYNKRRIYYNKPRRLEYSILFELEEENKEQECLCIVIGIRM